MVTVGGIQNFVGHKWIPIWANEPDVPTLWIYYDEQNSETCQKYAEKVAELINQNTPERTPDDHLDNDRRPLRG